MMISSETSLREPKGKSMHLFSYSGSDISTLVKDAVY